MIDEGGFDGVQSGRGGFRRRAGMSVGVWLESAPLGGQSALSRRREVAAHRFWEAQERWKAEAKARYAGCEDAPDEFELDMAIQEMLERMGEARS